MPMPPRSPKIYHITHIDNLSAIVESGNLLSDARIIAQGGPKTAIGMSTIKQRRLALPVSCHSGAHVGDFVPFYFCSRSVMLFLLHRANHPEITYRGGQEPIIHLEADLHTVIEWAQKEGHQWAISLSNAGARYTQFRCSLDSLSEINWLAVASIHWAAPDIREAKQAEFLLHDSFPWQFVERIGVYSLKIGRKAAAAIASSDRRPPVEIKSDWYY